MTNQDIFNLVVQRLAAQGRKSKIGSKYRCAYRGDEGSKCAVGWLISDDAYSIDIEGECCDAPRVVRALKCSGVPLDTMPMLYDLQTVHDDDDVIYWPENFANIARKHGLDPTVVKHAFGLKDAT